VKKIKNLINDSNINDSDHYNKAKKFIHLRVIAADFGCTDSLLPGKLRFMLLGDMSGEFGCSMRMGCRVGSWAMRCEYEFMFS
jgi:hypothetical protein